MPLPTLKRLSIGATLLAIEDLGALRGQSAEMESDLDSAQNYEKNKRIAKAYSQLINFLTGDALSVQEKTESIVGTMIVEFKSLVLIVN